LQHVLILSPFFYPEPISTGRYNLTMADALVKQGATVTVVCCHPFYPAWSPKYSNAQRPGITIIRGGDWLLFPRSSILRRAVLEAWFFFFAGFQAWRLRHTVDTVVAVFPPSLFFVGVSAILPHRVRRVGLIHDLQGVHASASQSRATRALVRVIGVVEWHAFAACDRLIVLSKAMALQLQKNIRADIKPLTVVYPFVNLDEADVSANRLAGIFDAGKVHIVYSGALGEKQNPAGLARIIEAVVQTHPNIHVHIFSEGPIFEWLRGELAQKDLPSISLHGLVPDQEVAELYQRADIQIIPQAFGTQHGSMPSKLPNILASGKKVLAICDVDSELNHVIPEFEAGIAINSWDPVAACEAIGQLVAEIDTPVKPENISRVRSFFSVDRLTQAILDVGDSI